MATNQYLSPSPEDRKRPLDEGTIENEHTVKRSRSYHSPNINGTYHFKILVPCVAAGAIIGKRGENIAWLEELGARIKMSKSEDFYPGTTDRVCLISGPVNAILAATDFMVDKIKEKVDVSRPIKEVESILTQNRHKHIKILAPNSTVSMIIGKGGSFIKQIKDSSGSYVQISQKPTNSESLQERCITVAGEMDQNRKACQMILDKIVEDPQSGTCLNVSYANVNGPVANYDPIGSPFAHANMENDFSVLRNGTGTGLNLNVQLRPGQNLTVASVQLLEHVQNTLRNTGISDGQILEICGALAVLSKYGSISIAS